MPKSWLVRSAESSDRARRRMQLMGVTPNGHPLWTAWEAGPVVELAPAYSLIFPMVERRTRPGVYSKAQRLGVAPNAPPRWSENEILRLRKFYPNGTRAEIEAAFSGRSYSAVAKMANSRGIYRAPKPLKATGHRLLDQVLARAKMLNLSRSDLDRMVRSKRYFQSSAWMRRADVTIHCRAAVVLGGTVRVAFSP